MGRPKGSRNKNTKILRLPTYPSESDFMQPESILKPTIEGFVNLQKSRFRIHGKMMEGHYTGADIHPTVEAARAKADHCTVGQIHVRWYEDDPHSTKESYPF